MAPAAAISFPRLAGFALLVLSVLAVAAPSRAQGTDIAAADRAAIATVIERQMAAFAKDDAATAFSFASPAIQHQFGSPDTFLQMVENGYPAVYRPRSVSFREARRAEDRVIQEVDIIGPDGNGVRAFYVMAREADGSWRIDGVSLAPGSEKET
jgi:ketosteroid isomerase-like protein